MLAGSGQWDRCRDTLSVSRRILTLIALIAPTNEVGGLGVGHGCGPASGAEGVTGRALSIGEVPSDRAVPGAEIWDLKNV